MNWADWVWRAAVLPGEKKPGPSMASHGFFSHACLSCDVPAPTTLSPHPPTLERLWPTPLDPCSRLRAARGLKYRQGRSWTPPPCTTVLWYIPLLHRLGSTRGRNEPHSGRGAYVCTCSEAKDEYLAEYLRSSRVITAIPCLCRDLTQWAILWSTHNL